MSVERERKIEAPVIECRAVHKKFLNLAGEEHVVIGDIDLQVKKNEFLVLFGPGQCGKTTMINLISGLLPATSGEITVNGKPVTGPGADRGVVYQTINLFPWLTTMGNVEYGPKIRGVGKEERQKKAQYYIDLVGLQGFEKAYPVKLSGGMKQRVGIARAYCNEPDVLLMDEPFGALDAQTRYMMQEEIEKIWQKEKRTVIFVTNNIEEALYLADRIVVLSNCPATIKAEYKIDLPRPRSYVDPEFLRLRKEITSIVDITK
ncbi:Aliphatic sulfonates import ATP-binding protein SsuB [uncultured Clostridium sp.]|nr:Aliphatic sulfonates import ATP-binding protein SsuB [uncultured Clostridium sp.]